MAENIYLGRELSHGPRSTAPQWKPRATTSPRLGANFGPKTVVEDLSIAERQLVEIARALHSKARILVMDEPTTPLSSRETDRLSSSSATCATRAWRSFISHRMAEIYDLSDQVSVLRDGTYVGAHWNATTCRPRRWCR